MPFSFKLQRRRRHLLANRRLIFFLSVATAIVIQFWWPRKPLPQEVLAKSDLPRANQGHNDEAPEVQSSTSIEGAENTMKQEDQGSPVVRPIFFVHFHKSGGTVACRSMIQRSSLTVTHPDFRQRTFKHNCNADFAGPRTDQRIITDAASSRNAKLANIKLTCDSLLPYTVDEDGRAFRRNNFVAAEVPLDGPVPCLGFRNFALMRHPIQRLQSHMKVHQWTEAFVRFHIKRMEKKPKRQVSEDKLNLMEHGFPCINNMIIRQLLGRQRFLDYTPIGEGDLGLAKTIVDQFDVFVPTEQQTHPKVQEVLKQQIPEYYQSVISYLQTQSDIGTKYNHSDDFVQLLREQNKYDILLYQHIHERLGIPMLELE